MILIIFSLRRPSYGHCTAWRNTAVVIKENERSAVCVHMFAISINLVNFANYLYKNRRRHLLKCMVHLYRYCACFSFSFIKSSVDWIVYDLCCISLVVKAPFHSWKTEECRISRIFLYILPIGIFRDFFVINSLNVIDISDFPARLIVDWLIDWLMFWNEEWNKIQLLFPVTNFTLQASSHFYHLLMK